MRAVERQSRGGSSEYLKRAKAALAAGVVATAIIVVSVNSPGGAQVEEDPYDQVADDPLDFCVENEVPSVLYDFNGDGLVDSYFCGPLPGCKTVMPIPGPLRSVMPQEQRFIINQNRKVFCRGEPQYPDFSSFFDTYPWADEFLRSDPVTSTGMTISEMLREYPNVPSQQSYWVQRFKSIHGWSTTEDTETTPPTSSTTAATQPTFDDIDEAGGHAPSVEALAEAGIVEGTECGGGGFCPNEPIDRWVMAVWLVRAVDGREPSPTSVSRFADVDSGRWWMPHVERLAVLGITSGCTTGPARFCPGDSVTRAQMATFLTDAFGLGAAPPAGFADTADNFHAANIDALAAAGITAGCTTDPLRYCPKKAVTRGQMATFLARALGLVPLPDIAEPTPPRLAYSRVFGSVSSVVVADADGSGYRSHAAGASGPSWSPKNP